MTFSLSNILEQQRHIRFVEPNFEYEWGEAERYPHYFSTKEQWLKLAQTGNIEIVNCSMLLTNTDMCRGKVKNLNPAKAKRALVAIQKGVVELPIFIKIGKRYELVAGNTRLTALHNLRLPTKAWVITVKK